jgi:hypothetical protein
MDINYISVETRDALCEAGIWGICLTLGTMTLACGIPWIWRKTAIKRRLLGLYIKLFWLKTQQKYRRYRAARRYKAAMRVFDKPVRWSEK